MKIKSGGQTERMGASKIEEIKISHDKDLNSFHLWINESSLTYLTLEEMMALKKEIQFALESFINQ